jgi:hypothetical protein
MRRKRAGRGDVSDAVTIRCSLLAGDTIFLKLGEMLIPEFAWFAVAVAGLAGCVAWHRKAPSRHLLMAIGGLGWTTLLGLPGLYASLFGSKELSRYADVFFDEATLKNMLGTDSAGMLIFWCRLLTWPGAAFLALALWRLGSSLTPRTQSPTAP